MVHRKRMGWRRGWSAKSLGRQRWSLLRSGQVPNIFLTEWWQTCWKLLQANFVQVFQQCLILCHLLLPFSGELGWCQGLMIGASMTNFSSLGLAFCFFAWCFKQFLKCFATCHLYEGGWTCPQLFPHRSPRKRWWSRAPCQGTQNDENETCEEVGQRPLLRFVVCMVNHVEDGALQQPVGGFAATHRLDGLASTCLDGATGETSTHL